ncbi:HAD family hydrolase [Lacticaseibacillus porcinae]|uniref:HAD hydrolase family protein n=1 Tax=Lacticaseibacillus porcinae TaxID=1123687 RepID=UPI001CDD4FFA|nr:HAD family hydrolase [Lacticaseibacillus porcinae]
MFTALDGALLNDLGNLTTTTAFALNNLGAPLSIITGRAPFELNGVLKRLQTDAPQIAFHGALIYAPRTGKKGLLGAWPLEALAMMALVRSLLASFPELGISVFDALHGYAVKEATGERYKLLGRKRLEVLPLQELFDAKLKEVYMISLMLPEAHLAKSVADFLHRLHLRDIRIVPVGDRQLDIVSRDARPTRGIDYIMTRYRLYAGDIVYFGCHYDEVRMADFAGVQIAMGNAEPALRADADYVTSTNNDNGVAQALQRFKLL